MKKLKLNFLVILVLLFAFSSVAGATMIIPAAPQAKENSRAPEKSPVISDDWGLERVDFIHYAKPASPGKAPKTESCYKLMGVKWSQLPVNYVINPTNPDGLSESFVTGAVSASTETWDAVTSKELMNNIYSIDYSVQYGIQNYQNAIVFDDYPNDNVIAITSVWYTPRGRQIVEFDILFNTRFDWGDGGINPAVMDLQNIATHELGHAVGLNDIYSTTCAEVTMYGYSTEGETGKKTLESADITGLRKMYGI